MPIPLPILDDRRWTDLVSEALTVIPVYSPEWTDHNASDPGLTIVELLAWVAEADIYRLNRIPPRLRRLLLRLMGVRPEGPRPAVAVAAGTIEAGSKTQLAAGTEFTGSDPDGVPVRFRSIADAGLAGAAISGVSVQQGAVVTSVSGRHQRGESVLAFGAPPQRGNALLIALSEPLPQDQQTNLYVRLAGPRTTAEERRRLIESTPNQQLPPHHSARTAWEALVHDGARDVWQSMEAADSTRSLTLSGTVRLRPIAPMVASAGLFHVRCRYVSGEFDSPPTVEQVILNGVELEQSAPVVETWNIAPGTIVSGAPPASGEYAFIEFTADPQGTLTALSFDAPRENLPAFRIGGFAAATATDPGALTLEAARAGTGSGAPNQAFRLRASPVEEATFELFSFESAGWRSWTRRDDLAASRGGDAYFILDPGAGTVTFGDGANGRVPPPGAVLVARYCDTRAGDGNVAAGSITAVAGHPDIAVTQPAPATGGRAAETIEHATGRAIQLREASLRAITLSDYEQLAIETPGTDIARVFARANIFPGLDCVSAPGNIVVVVLPAMPGPQPLPSGGLLAAVATRLERRRLIGTRVSVVAPRYLSISVRARVRPAAGASPGAVRDAIVDALNRFFDPLKGGPAGGGWPFGRDVYRSEILEAIDSVPGVDHVLALELAAGGGEPQCGNICLPPTWLAASGAHRIEVN